MNSSSATNCLLKLAAKQQKWITQNIVTKATITTAINNDKSTTNQAPVQVFSGIQPTGLPHLGNYFGALEQWIKLANERKTVIDSKLLKKRQLSDVPKKALKRLEKQNVIKDYTTEEEPKVELVEVDLKKPVYAIVDVHSYSSDKTVFGQDLYNKILDTVASLVALGLNENNCILLRQSDVLEHFYLDNVFDNFVSPNRLTRMTQYKDKTKDEKSRLYAKAALNGLLTYPILQTADILIYKGQLVPVGADQVQHLELAREIADKFNVITSSECFPQPQPIFNPSEHAKRLRSLRDPSKKMSKSDSNQSAYVSPLESADSIARKFRKALTDSIETVYYDSDERPAMSNLMRIHHLATGKSFDEIEDECGNGKTSIAQYKQQLSDIIIEKFREQRKLYEELRENKDHLEQILQKGHNTAKPIVSETIGNWAQQTRNANESIIYFGTTPIDGDNDDEFCPEKEAKECA